jgi:hypothetical protein
MPQFDAWTIDWRVGEATGRSGSLWLLQEIEIQSSSWIFVLGKWFYSLWHFLLGGACMEDRHVLFVIKIQIVFVLVLKGGSVTSMP